VHSMKSRCGYKGYVIEARSHELRDGGFSAEFSIEEHDGTGVTETQFLPARYVSVAGIGDCRRNSGWAAED